MIEVTDITEEQLQIEKEYNDIVDLYVALKLSEDEANEKLEELVNGAALSEKDEKSYIFRRDPPGHTRTHIEFAMWLRKTHREEKERVGYFCDWIRERGHIIRCESFGSDRNGRVLLFNVRKRNKSPLEPDYKVWINGKGPELLEIKNATGRKIYLKVYDLEHYRAKKVFIVVGFNGSCYLFKREVAKYLLDNISLPYRKEWGKEIITINENGVNADFSLEELKDKELVRSIKVMKSD